MKIFKNFFIVTIFFFAFATINHFNTMQARDNFSVTQDDREQLRSMGFSDKDIEEAATMLNNITPEEQERLEKTLKAVEEELEAYGIDPANPDPELLEQFTKDMFNASEEKPQEGQVAIKPKIEIKEEPEIEQVYSLDEAPCLLNAILKHITILRQKITLNPMLSQTFNKYQPKVNELVYYLNVLNKKELLRHLTSAPFKDLYENLQSLYKVLAVQEPRIKVQSSNGLDDYDDPYQELGVSYNATQEQINQAYQKLKNLYDPTIITKKLKNEEVSQKIIEKELEKAHVIFASIVDAYQRIYTPQERATTDRELKERIQSTSQTQKISNNAFTLILENLNDLFCNQNVLIKINNLLKAYEPEALAQRKAQEQFEQEALAQAKEAEKRKAPFLKVPSTSPRATAPDYSRYYARGSRGRNYGGNYSPNNNAYNNRSGTPSGSNRPSSPRPSSAGKPADKDKKKAADKSSDVTDKKSLGADNARFNTPTDTKTKQNQADALALTKKMAPESYKLSIAEDALFKLEKELLSSPRIRSFFNNIEAKLKQPIQRRKDSHANQLNAEIEFLRTLLRHIDSIKDIDLNIIKASPLLKNRVKVIKTNYQNILNNLDQSIMKSFNPNLPGIDPSQFDKHYAPFMHNNSSNTSQENPHNYYELYQLMHNIKQNFNTLAAEVPIRSTQDQAPPITDAQAQEIKIPSAIMSSLEIDSNILQNAQKNNVPQRILKDVEDYLLTPSSGNNTNNQDSATTTRSIANITDRSINQLGRLMSEIPRDLLVNLEILDSGKNAIKKSSFLSSRWNLIQGAYGKDIKDFYHNVQKVLDKDRVAQIIQQDKYNKHYEDFNSNRPLAVKSQLNQANDLQRYYKIAESINNKFKDITKKIVPQPTSPSAAASSPASSSSANTVNSTPNDQEDFDINEDLNIVQQ